ncbi:MAG: GH116 family glycosyl hydrolase [Bacillota bacterium]
MAKIYSAFQHVSGIPLGGLGTGSVEIRPDGHFYGWQMFNLGIWSPQSCPSCRDAAEPKMPPDSLSFFLRTEEEKKEPLIRHLGLRPDFANNYSAPWMKNIQAIVFEGRFPAARLEYLDETLPVEIRSEIFSSFMPHDAENSGIPGFYTVFKIRNRSPEKQRISLLALLRNPLAWGAPDRKLRNHVFCEREMTGVFMRTEAEMPCRATLGSMALAASGGDVTFISGDYERYFQGYVPHALETARAHEAVFHSFREKGRLVNSRMERRPSEVYGLTYGGIDAMSFEGKKEACRFYAGCAFAGDYLDSVAYISPELLNTDQGLNLVLKNLSHHLDALEGRDRTGQTWGNCALCLEIILAPGEEKEPFFLLGWHFPYHYSADGSLIGHHYENRFKDAREAVLHLAANRRDFMQRTLAFADSLYETSAGEYLADAWSGQLSTLIKCTWWAKNGDFAVWEGLGCCGFHTTDITYHGSFGILALFPELQQRQMEMGARFQREDGRVHHMFTPDLRNVDNGFERVDMNQQFVLLVCRDYLWTGDRSYLERLWPNILKAMESTARIDQDGDGLPDHDTRRNTYDDWNFFGIPSYVSSLWLSALLAGIRLAGEMGDEARAKEWREILCKAAANFEAKLWNGEYYSLWADGERRDECCMTDQIDGEWFTSLIGLGRVLSAERISKVLRAIFNNNYTFEAGLRNARYPGDKAPSPYTYRNFQAAGAWTGIEYSIASMMYEYGFTAEAEAVVRSIHDRQFRSGRVWNHMECGDHYYRAMSSWALLLAVSGFKLDRPKGIVTFRPAAEDGIYRGPWFSCTGWGCVTQDKDSLTITCKGGSLRWNELRTSVPFAPEKILLNGRPQAADLSGAEGLKALKFQEEVCVNAGDTFTVS